MSRSAARFRDLCAGWLLGGLEGEELREFEKLLRGADPQMMGIYSELEHAALHLPVSVPLEEPPADAKVRLMESIQAGRGAIADDFATKLARRLGFHRPRFALSVTLALALLIAGLGVTSLVLDRARSRDAQRLIALTHELEHKEQLLQVLQSKEVEIVALNGLEINPRGYGKVIWDTENKVAVLQVSNLPPVPEDKAYQFWVYPKEGEPASAGVFAVIRPDSDSFFRFEHFTSIDKHAVRGFLITLEPAGGAPQPGGDWYLGAYTDF